jgi:hypothetical protein
VWKDGVLVLGSEEREGEEREGEGMSNCIRCGAVWSDQHQSMCNECHEAKVIERWAKLPKVKWDGEGGIYSEAYDEYFWDEEGALEPVHAKPLDPDAWFDDIPDDGDYPEWLLDAIGEFNAKLKGQAPLSYEPGNQAVDTSGWEIPKEDDHAD